MWNSLDLSQRDAARALKRGNEGNIQALGQSISADALSKLTGVLGADIDVDTFISALPNHFTNFQLPDNNQEHNISEIKTVLQKMYDSNIGEDGIIFTSN